MKVETLIKKLEVIRGKYLNKYGKEPIIWAWHDDLDGLFLCSKIKKVSFGVEAIKPYMKFKKFKRPY